MSDDGWEWRRTAEGWELIEPGAEENEVFVTLELLAHPVARAAFEQEVRERGWPPLPVDDTPPPDAEGSFEPFRVEEVVMALDGGPAGLREAVAQRDARWLRRDAREAGVLDWRHQEGRGDDSPRMPTEDNERVVSHAMAILDGWRREFPYAPGPAQAAWASAARAVRWALDVPHEWDAAPRSFTTSVWPFTDEEGRAIRAAYEALTRVGNVTAHAQLQPDPEHGGWDPMLDKAHHQLGLMLAIMTSRRWES